jgi:predicted transcriptional regulator
LHRGGIERTALADAYSPTWMVDTRLERLVENGFLARDGDSYRLTEKGRSLIRSFGQFRAVFKHERRAP